MNKIEKIKKLVAGVGGRGTPRIGYTPKTIHMRREGEIWEEPSGRKFVMENGERKQITKIPPKGFDKCSGWEGSDCKKLILKTLDQQTYNRFQRCRVCQMEFEADLHRKGEWQDWVKEMEEKRWETILKEYEQEFEEVQNSKALKFDKKVATALAGHEHRK
tara:strand:- start:257 stop:739 length:483 start_codon:yes stop_codon:yes gene_type:complete